MLIHETGRVRLLKFLIATAFLCISVATAQAAGLQLIEVPADADEPVIKSAGHYSFLAPCSPELAAKFPRLCEDHSGFDRVAFHQELNAAVLAFFQKHLMHSESISVGP